MGLKLRILSYWTPEWFLKRGLNELARSTINGLEEVLSKDNPEYEGAKTLHSIQSKSHIQLKGNLEEMRINMSRTHNELVESMINSLGRDKAINIGRKAMFKEGLSLGKKFREILGVGDSLEDLISAAKILYKVLGIEFNVKELSKVKGINGEMATEGEILMEVHLCALSEYYNGDTCRVLSAADEGVVQGLNPHIKMKFTDRITEGAPCCLATLQLKGD